VLTTAALRIEELAKSFGGVRALEALEIHPSVIHLNEGHSAFCGLERIRTMIEQSSLDFATAREVVAAGRAIATVPDWVASALAHPGVIARPLKDAPPVTTRLVWRESEEHPFVPRLVELAAAWARDRQVDATPHLVQQLTRPLSAS